MNHMINQKYFIPAGLRVYAIGDVHGYAGLLRAMHEAIARDLAEDSADEAHIVHLGDYVDRGPDSKGVIDVLMVARDLDDGVVRHFLRGNHEDGMFEFMDDPLHAAWLKWGGVETLASYGIAFDGDVERAAAALRASISGEHLAFYDGLALSHEIGDYFFAHAGVDPFKPFDAQTRKDLTRIRQPFLSWHKEADYVPLARRVVHGHTIAKEPIERPHRVGVDTGAYEHGVLTAAVLEGGDVRFLQVG